ncbi:enoyl-CoA hydratase-related protein [Sphingobium sp. CR2-8]|uniref:enoyl-CoA hydratase-related protein n=1 Tax=Sphingobium sp. CR2-8 TaxID=1306534 RepID=UPI002DB5FB36|nr:enoyl-CoA hydratase-related protein [Sphingobium sp. CR2-8]MEC3911885.1 enoyl-CoA hydratase-related protein [Sphingobium sp. CR2-8]
MQLAAPHRLNALSPAMSDALIVALGRAQSESRAILLSGAGRSFCSGVDLGSADAVPRPDLDGGLILERHFNPLITAVRDLQVPIICAVQGAAAGVGMALALSCDIVVAGSNAFFLAPFASIGLLPDSGLPSLLTRAVGRARALEVLMLAQKLNAQRAHDWGLIARVMADDTLLDEARALATTLAKGPTVALAGIRALCWHAAEQSLAAELDLERDMQRKIPATADCQEGNRAFREKRAPRFLGR